MQKNLFMPYVTACYDYLILGDFQDILARTPNHGHIFDNLAKMALGGEKRCQISKTLGFTRCLIFEHDLSQFATMEVAGFCEMKRTTAVS